MILRLGSRGQSVRDLQILLQRHGMWTFHTITDFFGNVTETAVKNFQKERGLEVDGVVGPATWSELLQPVKNDIIPVCTECADEDFSDPEDEMEIEDVQESQPTCPNIYELINLIMESNITRRVTRLVFHCTATHQTATVEGILRHWRERRGWKNPGYHIIVKPDGSWTQLSDFNNVTNGVRGINATSIHIAYIGGIDRNARPLDNRTDEQKEVFEVAYNTFKEKMPELTFHGHYEFSRKACPSFDVEEWIESINDEA